MRTSRLRARTAGFTLVELIIVITLLGVLSFAAASRLSDRDEVNAHGLSEELANTLRFAQKAAVAQRRNINVLIDAAGGRVRVCLDSADPCLQPILSPSGGALLVLAPNGIALTSTTAQFSFDALGRPSAASGVSITAAASDGTQFAVRVEAESGYVRRT